MAVYFKDQCKRCMTGMDPKNVGRCSVCSDISYVNATKMRMAQARNFGGIARIVREGTFVEVRNHLVETSSAPLVAIAWYRGTYPNFGDFEAAQRKKAAEQAEPDSTATPAPKQFPGTVLEFVNKRLNGEQADRG
jgi:hypothetical protein